MKVTVGSDHRGVNVKQLVVNLLARLGHEVTDVGTDTPVSVDYPDIALQVATAVGTGQADRGILICGTGIGMSIAANKVRGVRSAPCHDIITAELARSHNNTNVLSLSADMLGPDLIERMVKIWLETPFEAGRHARRVDKITQYENNLPDPSI